MSRPPIHTHTLTHTHTHTDSLTHSLARSLAHSFTHPLCHTSQPDRDSANVTEIDMEKIFSGIFPSSVTFRYATHTFDIQPTTEGVLAYMQVCVWEGYEGECVYVCRYGQVLRV